MIVGLIFEVISLLFIWKEDFDIYRKIKDQKISNYFVSVFTAVGTLVTPYYSIKQYKLSELANKTAIMPDIFPQTHHIQMEDHDGRLEIESIHPDITLTHPMDMPPEKNLEIKNVGVGIAKNVQTKWIFDDQY